MQKIAAFLLASVLFWAALPQPLQAVPLPLVSATELDPITTATIRERYPEGLRIFSNNITRSLRKKLQALEKAGYTINWLEPNNQQLNQLAESVMKHHALQTYLIKAYGENPGCPKFLRTEILEYAMRKNGKPAVTSVSQLSSYPVSAYQSLLDSHHWWVNIGYKDSSAAPETVRSWLKQHSKGSGIEKHTGVL